MRPACGPARGRPSVVGPLRPGALPPRPRQPGRPPCDQGRGSVRAERGPRRSPVRGSKTAASTSDSWPPRTSTSSGASPRRDGPSATSHAPKSATTSGPDPSPCSANARPTAPRPAHSVGATHRDRTGRGRANDARRRGAPGRPTPVAGARRRRRGHRCRCGAPQPVGSHTAGGAAGHRGHHRGALPFLAGCFRAYGPLLVAGAVASKRLRAPALVIAVAPALGAWGASARELDRPATSSATWPRTSPTASGCGGGPSPPAPPHPSCLDSSAGAARRAALRR